MSAPLPPLAIAPPSAPTAAPPRAPMPASFAVAVILSFALRAGAPWAAATRVHAATADWDGTPVRAGADVAGAGVAGWAAGVVGAWATVAEGDADGAVTLVSVVLVRFASTMPVTTATMAAIKRPIDVVFHKSRLSLAMAVYSCALVVVAIPAT